MASRCWIPARRDRVAGFSLVRSELNPPRRIKCLKSCLPASRELNPPRRIKLDAGCETTEDPRQRNREACTGGKLQDGGRMTEKNGISNIEQGISNDEGWGVEVVRSESWRVAREAYLVKREE